jgi:hypothetical protein
MFENVIIELHNGEVELKWSSDADSMCSDIRSFARKSSVIGGPTYCKECEILPECPLKKYRETIENVQNDLQRDYNAGFKTSDKALYHLDKALHYLLIATTEDYKIWKEKEQLKLVSRKLAGQIQKDLESLALQNSFFYKYYDRD